MGDTGAVMPRRPGGDGAWNAVLAEIVRRTETIQPDELAEAANACCAPLGIDLTLFLVDQEHRRLWPIPERGKPTPPPLVVEGTVGGRAFTSVTTQGDVAADGSLRLWIPMVDGADRVGLAVVKVPSAPQDSPQLRRGAEMVVALIAHLVSVNMPYGDLLHRIRRTEPMHPSGELLLSLLPPLTFSCRQVMIAALLEPCYDVGGDAFDYAVDGSVAHFTILDAMGRGMQAALTAAAVLAATRAARRAGADLSAIVRAGDTVLAEQFPQFRFVTAVFGELDTTSGRLRYVNAGHPPPAVLRRGELRQTLSGGRRLPLGLPEEELAVAQEYVQPGDRILLYTDGVTEHREREAPSTGVRWLVDAARRSAPDGLPAPEWLRLLARAVITPEDGRKVDDATLMLVEWLGADPVRP